MGNFASGISVGFKYRKAVGFWENAHSLHKRVKVAVQKDSNSNIALKLYASLEPALEDSVFYSLYDNFSNKISAFTAYILKLKGKKRGLGITNLGRMDIPVEYGLYKLETVFFIPPYWPNNEKVLGIVTSGGRMNVSIQYQPSAIEPSIVSTVWSAARKCLEEAVG